MMCDMWVRYLHYLAETGGSGIHCVRLRYSYKTSSMITTTSNQLCYHFQFSSSYILFLCTNDARRYASSYSWLYLQRCMKFKFINFLSIIRIGIHDVFRYYFDVVEFVYCFLISSHLIDIVWTTIWQQEQESGERGIFLFYQFVSDAMRMRLIFTPSLLMVQLSWANFSFRSQGGRARDLETSAVCRSSFGWGKIAMKMDERKILIILRGKRRVH